MDMFELMPVQVCLFVQHSLSTFTVLPSSPLFKLIENPVGHGGNSWGPIPAEHISDDIGTLIPPDGGLNCTRAPNRM